MLTILNQEWGITQGFQFFAGKRKTVVENQDLETGIRSYWLSFNFNLHVVESKPSNSQVMESQQNHVGRIWYANPNPLQGGQSNTMQSQRRIAG